MLWCRYAELLRRGNSVGPMILYFIDETLIVAYIYTMHGVIVHLV